MSTIVVAGLDANKAERANATVLFDQATELVAEQVYKGTTYYGQPQFLSGSTFQILVNTFDAAGALDVYDSTYTSVEDQPGWVFIQSALLVWAAAMPNARSSFSQNAPFHYRCDVKAILAALTCKFAGAGLVIVAA